MCSFVSLAEHFLSSHTFDIAVVIQESDEILPSASSISSMAQRRCGAASDDICEFCENNNTHFVLRTNGNC